MEDKSSSAKLTGNSQNTSKGSKVFDNRNSGNLSQPFVKTDSNDSLKTAESQLKEIQDYQRLAYQSTISNKSNVDDNNLMLRYTKTSHLEDQEGTEERNKKKIPAIYQDIYTMRSSHDETQSDVFR